MSILLDTCALIWWSHDPALLSRSALDACNSMPAKGGMVSAISIWEIGIKIKRKRLDLGMTLDQYVQRLQKARYLEIVPVDHTVWVESIKLNWEHKDPADRVIVATARLRNVLIVTADELIKGYCKKKVIW